MRYAQENELIDNEIRRLQSSNNPEAQMRINALQQQRNANSYQMHQPMRAEEYDEYDDYGNYIGNPNNWNLAIHHSQPHQNTATGNVVTDAIGHAAQGASLGWSDEIMGAIGGAGQVIGNALWRATGHSTKGETFADAWHNGYNEYRDFARQELNNGYQRNPTISTGAEIAGALAIPLKPFRAK